MIGALFKPLDARLCQKNFATLSVSISVHVPSQIQNFLANSLIHFHFDSNVFLLLSRRKVFVGDEILW